MTWRRSTPGDDGETLIEVLVAVVIMAGVGVVFLTGLAVAAKNSSTQAGRATAHALVVSAAERLTTTPFVECARPADYEVTLDAAAVPDGYTVSIVGVHGWNGRAYEDTSTRLAADVSVTDTTVKVVDATGFPRVTPFRIQLRDTTDELLTVTKRDDTTLTVTRGAGAGEHPAESSPTVLVCPALQRIDLVVTGRGDAIESRSVTLRGDPPAGAGG